MSKRTKWKHPLFSRYKLIKYHCENENSVRYHQYGGRGIKLKKSWSTDFFAFADWIEEHLGLPTSYLDVLERIDNDGDYRPGNLRWATAKDNHNNRRTNTYIKIGRKTQTLQQWCDQQGVWVSTATRRMSVMGLDPVYAFGLKPHPACKPIAFSTKTR